MAVTPKVDRNTRTRSDTIGVDQQVVEGWKPPPFQRPLRINVKVRALAELIKADGGVIPGVITLGKIGTSTYLLDGQHRVQAFLLSDHKDGYADIRIHEFDSMADMGKEFVNLNSRLVNLRPDDILRGLEGSLATLKNIKERCAFVGYDMIRRSEKAPFVSMASLLRSWNSSSKDSPIGSSTSAMDLAHNLTLFDASTLSDVTLILEKAWGRHLEYARLWNGLNLTMCFWLFRRMVLAAENHAIDTAKRHTPLSRADFQKCMAALSADGSYLDWLVGRSLTPRDISPCLARIRSIMVARYQDEHPGKKIKLPQPEWAG